MSTDTRSSGTWRDAVTRQEIDELLAMNDWLGWGSIALNWSIVFASMALVAVWPNPLTIIAALFLIGARQLGFAVMMHESSHRSLISNKKWNDWAGNWLCAYPVWSDIYPYRPYHLQHHAHTGTDGDPDLALTAPFPITRESLRRKFWRDLSGQTGIKFARGSTKRTFGRYHDDPVARRAAQGVVISNAVLLGILTFAGHPWLYLLWVGAWLTTNTLVTRIRAIAEHAMTPDAPEPNGRTRTTEARWWERLLIAPNGVNYHLEHHLLITVPHYKLKAMHALLTERGVLEHACIDRGYLSVLKRASSKAVGAAPDEPVGAGVAPRIPPF